MRRCYGTLRRGTHNCGSMRVAVKALTFLSERTERRARGPNLNWCQKAMGNDKTLFFFVFCSSSTMISNCEFKESWKSSSKGFSHWNVGGMKPRTITMPIVEGSASYVRAFRNLAMKRNGSVEIVDRSRHKACNYSMEYFYDSCYLHVRLLSWHSPHGFIFSPLVLSPARRQAQERAFRSRLSSGRVIS